MEPQTSAPVLTINPAANFQTSYYLIRELWQYDRARFVFNNWPNTDPVLFCETISLLRSIAYLISF